MPKSASAKIGPKKIHLACNQDVTSSIREKLKQYGQRGVRGLVSEPMSRPLQFSEHYLDMEKSFNATSERHCVGTAVYMVGEKQRRPCKECTNRPVFRACVVKSEVAKGACASCIYRGCRSRCDFFDDGSQGVEDLCQSNEPHALSPALTAKVENDRRNVTEAPSAAAMAARTDFNLLKEQNLETSGRHISSAIGANPLVLRDEAQPPNETAKVETLHSANVQDFRNPRFRHEGCPSHPEYCRNVHATAAVPPSKKSSKVGQVARGHRFLTAQANRENVYWLLRHSSCSNAETLQRAWQHRLTRRKNIPLRDREGKAEFLSRWYPQWLTRIAAELDDTLETDGWPPGEKKKQRRAQRKRGGKAK